MNKEDAVAQYIKKTNELNVFVNSSSVAISDDEEEENKDGEEYKDGER